MKNKPANETEESLQAEDELFLDAKCVVLQIPNRTFSHAYIQRRLKVGFGRANLLIDMLEEAGIVIRDRTVGGWIVSAKYLHDYGKEEESKS